MHRQPRCPFIMPRIEGGGVASPRGALCSAPSRGLGDRDQRKRRQHRRRVGLYYPSRSSCLISSSARSSLWESRALDATAPRSSQTLEAANDVNAENPDDPVRSAASLVV